MLEPRANDTRQRTPDSGLAHAEPGMGKAGSRAVTRPTARRRPVRPPRLWGTRPGRSGVFLVIGAVAVGTVATVLTGSEPGLVLGVFLVAGTVAAALAVRPRAAYLMFPVPAPAYAVAAAIAGLIHDRAADTSRTALALSAVQWIASGFVAMTLATALAIAIALLRWLRSIQPVEPGSATSDRHGPSR
jgi:hypothetical protein